MYEDMHYGWVVMYSSLNECETDIKSNNNDEEVYYIEIDTNILENKNCIKLCDPRLIKEYKRSELCKYELPPEGIISYEIHLSDIIRQKKVLLENSEVEVIDIY